MVMEKRWQEDMRGTRKTLQGEISSKNNKDEKKKDQINCLKNELLKMV